MGQQFEHRLVNKIGVRPVETRVFGRGQPVLHHPGERVGRHAGGRRHDQFYQRVLATGSDGFEVAFERSLKRLFVLPLGVRRRQRFDPAEGEDHLNVHRFFGPQAAVIVEDGDAFRQRHEGFHPDTEGARGLLFHEDQLPVPVAQGGQIAVVGEVEDFLAQAGDVGRVLEVRGEVITVEVDLVFTTECLGAVAVEEILLDVLLAGGMLFFDEGNRAVRGIVINGLHALFGQRSGNLYLLAAVRLGPKMNYAPGSPTFESPVRNTLWPSMKDARPAVQDCSP